MVGFTFQNVGLATLPKRSAYFSFTINDQVVFKSRGNPFPITPGGIDSGGRPVKNFRSSFKLNKPGRYEVRFRVWLVERFGETNLDNNELIHYVDVEE